MKQAASQTDRVQRPRLVLAGTHSGAGKTTLTLGVMAALHRRGLRVQGYKVGPDYIDPSYHQGATGRQSRNLDSWMMCKQTMLDIFLRSSAEADISIIEGVMGYFDGLDPLRDTGSTAEVSQALQAPVVLVVDAGGMARSAAAVVRGFQSLEAQPRIAGVIVNRVGSVGHFRLLQAAVEQVCHIPVLGYLQTDPDLKLPERHLGLIPALERGELSSLFDRVVAAVEQTVDLDKLLQLAQGAVTLRLEKSQLFLGPVSPPQVSLAVAKDVAFNFYYPENLELLEHAGARLVFFSPLAGEVVPAEADGLYLGGGFPEEFAAQLSGNSQVLASVRECIQRGMPTFAECGGYMFLTQSITNHQGDTYPMVGVIPAHVVMESRLMALGYREVVAVHDTPLLQMGEVARGHEFHYSRLVMAEGVTVSQYPPAYQMKSLRQDKLDGYGKDNLVAGYAHLHFASHPEMARRFVAACQVFQRGRQVKHRSGEGIEK
ncbi:cobyrinate a,c-diamide synthase [Alicyclobacillaceae bacterium I2511]|nr:cobyrinate a,c-diamide synthase [Alicyclobacillaceae bacterium I2511]